MSVTTLCAVDAEPLSGKGLHLLDASSYWGPSGGVRRVLSSKKALLRGLGWQHTILAPGASGDGAVDCGGLRLPGPGAYRVPLARAHMERLIVERAPDLVEAADPYVLAWAVLGATERLKVPAVAFCHNNLPSLAAQWVGGMAGTRTWRGRWAERQARRYLVQLYQRFDLVLAPSQGLVQQLREAGINRVLHQPLGVDSINFAPARADAPWRWQLLRRLELPPRTRLLTYTGRFAREKNLDLLADAVRVLGPNHVLLAVGSGPHPPRGEQVRVLANEDDSRRLARLLACSDAYVHAGDQETFGLGVLEAMACGTPVVCSMKGGTGELTRDVGYQVASRNPVDWADAISACLHDNNTALRRLALERAREHSWTRVLGQLSRRYLSLTGDGLASSADQSTAPAAFDMGSRPPPAVLRAHH